LLIQQIVFTFRTSELDSTGMSPHEAVFGKRPRLPTDIIWRDASGVLYYGLEHKLNLPLEIRQAWERVLKFAVEYDKERLSRSFRGRNKVEFKVDSFVMLHTPPQQEYDEEGKRIEGGPTKLLLRWSGPFRVVNIGSNDNVWIIEQDEEEAINVAILLAYEPFRNSSNSTPKILLKLHRRSQESCAPATDEEQIVLSRINI
jgi:hypothetical protein